MPSKDAAHDVFVDLDAKRVRNLLGNSRTTEARIAVLHFEDRRDEFLRGPFPPLSLPCRVPIFDGLEFEDVERHFRKYFAELSLRHHEAQRIATRCRALGVGAPSYLRQIPRNLFASSWV